jgi:hypothetical protein
MIIQEVLEVEAFLAVLQEVVLGLLQVPRVNSKALLRVLAEEILCLVLLPVREVRVPKVIPQAQAVRVLAEEI